MIHSQAHLEPHLQTDGDILVELLLTQVLVVAVAVLAALVVMALDLVMEDPVEQVFNFLQHIETQLVLWDSPDQVVVDIG